MRTCLFRRVVTLLRIPEQSESCRDCRNTACDELPPHDGTLMDTSSFRGVVARTPLLPRAAFRIPFAASAMLVIVLGRWIVRDGD